MAHIRALEIATFYTMFNLAPVGRYHVQLCGTTPCMLRGAEELKKACYDRIGHERNVTADGLFSWIEVECLGACVNAPMAQINYDYYEDLTLESFNRVLDNLAAGKKVKPGPQIKRQFSAPVGGPTTLTDPALYSSSTDGGVGAATGADRFPLQDEEAKRPGEPASVHEAPAPKPPMGDSSRGKRTTRRE
jgi:NADH-quinone oxidoreductase subunit E